MPDSPNTEAIFMAALEIEALDQREAYVAESCGDDAELRQRVDALLGANEVEDSFLKQPAAAFEATFTPNPDVTADHHRSLEPGMVISERYTLREKIGEGGMGEVWVAKQSEPVQRRVALKLIKTGMDSKAVLARFEQERQALALMDHPNIARVLDAGMTATGQPFFVMELVNGLPLDKFCDQAKLSLQARLELFVPICQAVQHAHQKGIVHRDLKPANVLVTMIDGKPVPKVIDFGVAKAFGGKLTDETMTQFGAVVGTMAYMSPEQAGFSGDDIDTRADIYSLGVLLYELLTGLRPIDKGRLEKAALTEMVRIIREEEPSKPSTRLSTDAALPSLAAVRQSDPKKLTAMLRGELDWVVMKCLEKNRERRYETANGLVRDIQRYLTDEPVEARPPSNRYRLQKFLKRNKGPAIAAALVLLTLVTGVTGTTFGLIEAKRQEGIAVREAGEKETARKAEADRAEGERLAKLDAQNQTRKANAAVKKETAAKQQAQKRLKQIEKANEILGSIFQNLNPTEVKKGEIPLSALLARNLDKAVQQLEGEAIGDPLVVATMQNKFGRSLLGLGFPKKAIVLFQKSLATRQAKLGSEHPKTLTIMHNLAFAYRAAGDVKRALPLYEKTLKLKTKRLGPEHPSTLVSMNNLASTYRSAGDLKRAMPLLEKTLKLYTRKRGPEHPTTLSIMGNLAFAYQEAGDPKRALPLFEKTLKLSTKRLGPEHPQTLISMSNLASAYKVAGDLKRALPLYEKTLKLTTAKLGPEHPQTLAFMSILALAYRTAGDPKQALSLHEKTLKLKTKILGPEHPGTLASMNNVALAYISDGDLKRALPLYEKTLKLTTAKLGPEHPQTRAVMNGLALAYREAGDPNRALPLYEKTLKLTTAKLGPEHPDTLASMNNLALAYISAGDLKRALSLLEKTLKLMLAKFGSQHPTTGRALRGLSRVYMGIGRVLHTQGDYAAADKALAESLVLARRRFGNDLAKFHGLLALHALNLLALKKYAQAEPVSRECLAAREKLLPDHWLLFNTKCLLGRSLLGQKKYTDAEPLLLAGYNGMQQREQKIPGPAKGRIIEAVEALVALYEATGKRTDAANWKTELAKRQAAEKARLVKAAAGKAKKAATRSPAKAVKPSSAMP